MLQIFFQIFKYKNRAIYINIKRTPLQTLKLLLDKFKYFYIPYIRMKYSVVFKKNLKYKYFLSKNRRILIIKD